MTIIAPSLLAVNFLKIGEEIKTIEEAGADWLHIDVMDGHFVPNLSFGLPIIESIRPQTNLFLDVHLMISNPAKYIDKYIEAGADSITFHVEVEENIKQVIDDIKRKGKRVGLSLKPNTSVSEIIPYLENIDMVLFMTVEPGFGGQKFIEEVLKKIEELDKLRKGNKNLSNLLFQVDGGINITTADMCKKVNVDVLVAGTTVFKSENKSDIINELKRNTL